MDAYNKYAMLILFYQCKLQECQGHNDKLVIFEILVSVSVLGVGINSSSNFLIYMLRGRKFRRMARKTLCQWIGLRNHSEADRYYIGRR